MKTLSRRRAERLIWCMFVGATMIRIMMYFHTGKSTRSLHSKTSEAANNSQSVAEPSDTWVNHLCPRYRPKDTFHHMRLGWQAPTRDTIFFTETSCGLQVSGRQACAVESASLHHPDSQILILTTAPSVDLSRPLLKILFGLHNVKFSWLDLNELFLDSALQNWHEERQWLIHEERASIFISDAARWALLQKYGGIYLDMDALSLRTLPKIPDYIGQLDERQINGAVVALTKGHSLSRNIVNAIPKVFDPYQCCTIGPELVTSVLGELCPGNISDARTSSSQTLNNLNIERNLHPNGNPYIRQTKICFGITVFPVESFYPFSFELEGLQRFLMFKSGRGYWEKFSKSSNAYNLHLYNSLTHKEKVAVGGDSVLEEVMKRNCPKVYNFLSKSDSFI